MTIDSVRLARVEAVHRALLEKWRAAMDLVGPGPVDVHFDDSRAAIEDLDAEGPWADLGSGAGFPGVALAAAWPDTTVHLVESRQKRATFLRHVVADAHLGNAVVVHGRSEELQDGAYVGVIGRAYKPPPAFLEDAARLLMDGGRAVLLLAHNDPPDLAAWHVEDDRRGVVGGTPRRRLVLRR